MESCRHVRNKVNSLNRTLKKKYYSNKIQESVGNLKQTWKIANQILNKSSKTTKIDSIRLDDKTITDKKIIPNIMNEYFCNIGNSLKESVPYEKNPLMEGTYNINSSSETFTFSEISEEEVISASHSFKTSFGSGIDNVSSFFIKTASPIIAKHLDYIFNHSLYMGEFPNNWKIARVSPIYKEGSPDERSNYRPISVLPVLSRLFEKLVYNQLYKYLDRHKFLYKHQSGFRSIHSVVTCLLSNTNEWYLNLDDKKYTGIVFIHLKKAFDTVDHAILAKKLYLYGVRNTESKWFQSYLSDRQQLCKVNGISSNLQFIKCGVPQGSCLGPLVFLLFINDMPLSLHNSKVTMYADDTSLAYAFNSIDDITTAMNTELESLKKWLHGNKLALNVTKTTSMIIGTNRKLHESNSGELIQAHFKISGEAIEQKTSVKYLGVILDNQMKWIDHINLISSKVSRAIGIIKCAKKVLPFNLLKMLYLGLVEPHFRYCCSVWGSCGATTRKAPDKLQNRAIRIITNSAYDVSVGPLLKQLQLPSISDMSKQESASMVYKALNAEAPIYLAEQFTRVSDITSRTLRSSNLSLRPPRLKSRNGQNCFAYRGSYIWNSLSSEIKSSRTYGSFQTKLKAMLAETN